jgi:hypothetical protein
VYGEPAEIIAAFSAAIADETQAACVGHRRVTPQFGKCANVAE